MGTGFVLTGPAPAAREFLCQIVLAIVSGDPHVSDKMIEGACIAVRDLPGFTEIERREVVIAQLEKLSLFGVCHVPTFVRGQNGKEQMVERLSEALRAGAEHNRSRVARGTDPWGAF